jgi:uncharacterized protein (TIGR02646 family)
LRNNAHAWNEDFTVQKRVNAAARFDWRNRECYGHIRDKLLEMTSDHCAFCDGPLRAESRATVEHFRPKTDFAAHAYDWDNLFPCCDMCQSHKGEKFDERLLKPDALNYYFVRYFVANYRTGEIEPLPGAPAADRERAEETIKLYGLNTAQRRKARKREWEFFMRADEPDVTIEDYHYRFFLEA